MATQVPPPQQHKQPSRKGKKAWRKNVDVSEVTTGLDSLREEVIQGGVISEKPSDELFVLDTAGSEDVKKQVQKQFRPLKADEILAQRSAVPAVDTRKRSSSGLTNGIIEPSSKKRKSGGVSHKELQRLKTQYRGDAENKDIVIQEGASHDPWAVEAPKQDPRFDFLPEKKPIREPETLKHAPIVLSKSGKPFPAVKKPTAGKSYNPLFEDWQAHLEREGEKEVEAEKKRLKEAQEDQERLERALAAAQESEHESDDGNESAWESEWEGIQSEAEEGNLKQKRPERKTPTQRNKAKRRKEAERQAKWEAQMKKRDQQAERIRELAKQIEEKEKAKAEQMALVTAEESSSEDEVEVLRKKKFGKAPIPEAPLEVVLPDELQDSLRLLKPEGNLLKDRMRNLYLRGKVESRRQVQHKKAKREVTEKWSYKDWKLDRK